MNKLLHIFNSCGTHYANFSKEYTANTKEELIHKIQVAKQGICERLVQLNIIPKSIRISEDRTFYQIKNGKFAIKIHFLIEYYSLASSTPEEKEEIYNKIEAEQHNMRHFEKKGISAPRCLKGARYVSCYGNILIINVTADSEQELIDKVKTNIWYSLKENNETPQFNIQTQIENLKFQKTQDGKYVASYRQHNHPVQRRTGKENGKNYDEER